jgi:alpha-mannosidase/mannosylglycerate hydrolase
VKKISSSPPNIHLVFSSHWDREWYLPFQHFRAKLVRVLDQVLEELESGRLPLYQMDGQFIPVQDYLEIRPEKTDLLRRLIGEGRFIVGPWFTLPDEFLVSGESLVRNLQLGMKRASAWGQTSRAGWLCDLFGHNTQMPQIFRLLGIDNALLWRGVPPHLGNLFNWRAADGSEVRTYVFPLNGYCDFAGILREIGDHTIFYSTQERVTKALEYLQRPGNEGRQNLLWFDGADHVDFDPKMVEFVEHFNREAKGPKLAVSTLDRFLAAARNDKPGRALPSWKGEMREPIGETTNGWLIPGVGSSRIPLKQANHACETLLTLWAEPWCSTAQEQGGLEYAARALELAWEFLLTNHPHDSICGCSTDEVHADMPYRFAQCRQLAEVNLAAALDLINRQALTPLLKKDELGLSLFAPVGGDGQDNPEVSVRFPRTWPQFNEFFGFESKPSFKIFTPQGRELRYQLLQVTPHVTHVKQMRNKVPLTEDRIGARLAIETRLAPGEVQHLVLRPATGATRISFENALGVAPNCLRNAFLEITAESNGTLTLHDRVTGQVYRNQLLLEDIADIGDGWFHGIALTDQSYLSTGGKVSLGLTENGPLLARLHLRVEWEVPREFLFNEGVRSRDLVPLVVEHRVTLRKESRYAEIETTVHNTARDHCLRLHCPSGLASTKTFSADAPYDAVERPIALRKDRHLLKELQVETTPQQNWVAVGDGKHGLALLAPGQYESGVLDQPERPLVVTLLRAFRRAVFTDGNEGGQIQGAHKFALGLAPLKLGRNEPMPAARLSRWAQDLAAPVRARFMNLPSAPEATPARKSKAPQIPAVSGDVVLSASYAPSPGQRLIRFFNPANRPTTVKLTGASHWKEIDLEGKLVRKLSGRTLKVAAHKIVTLIAEI